MEADSAPQTPAVFHLLREDHPESRHRPLAEKYRREAGKGETQLLLDELAECVAGSESPETELLRKELTASLNRFLRKLPEKDRTVFLLRYYYAGTKDDIARKTGLSSNQVKYILQKVRKQLADTLKKEGLQ